MRTKNSIFQSRFFGSVVALLLSMVVSGVILAASGCNPFMAYSVILSGAFGSLRGFSQMLTQATPLIFTGLAFTFSKKASLINLGVEGQMYMGALGAAVVAVQDLGIPAFFHVLIALLSGMAFGALYAAIIGFLKVRFGSNEVVASVMLNNIATCVVAYLLNGVLLAEGSSVAQTERVAESAQLPRLFPKYQVTIAVFIAIASCFFIKWFIERTTAGYEIRCVGISRQASETAGIRIGAAMITAMCVSGAIAGLAGVNQVLGVDRRLIKDFSPGFGFNGIAVSALAAEDPVGVIFAGLIFGIMRAGALELNRSTGIPSEFVDVIQAMVVIFVAAPLLLKDIGQIKKLFEMGRAKEG